MTGSARIDEVVRLIDEALAAFAPDLSQPDAGSEPGDGREPALSA